MSLASKARGNPSQIAALVYRTQVNSLNDQCSTTHNCHLFDTEAGTILPNQPQVIYPTHTGSSRIGTCSDRLQNNMSRGSVGAEPVIFDFRPDSKTCASATPPQPNQSTPAPPPRAQSPPQTQLRR